MCRPASGFTFCDIQMFLSWWQLRSVPVAENINGQNRKTIWYGDNLVIGKCSLVRPCSLHRFEFLVLGFYSKKLSENVTSKFSATVKKLELKTRIRKVNEALISLVKRRKKKWLRRICNIFYYLITHTWLALHSYYAPVLSFSFSY